MANTNNKQCHSCGLFCDCWKCNGVQSPPCAILAEDSQTPTNKQSDEIIAEIMEYINQQCERHRSVDYHIDTMVALRYIKRLIAR
jgi:hypothetical protein